MHPPGCHVNQIVAWLVKLHVSEIERDDLNGHELVSDGRHHPANPAAVSL